MTQLSMMESKDHKTPPLLDHEKDKAGEGQIQAAITGTQYTFYLQVFSKLITFTINQIILRYTTPQIFGIATIQLELLVSTLFFFTRECIRLTILRVPNYKYSSINPKDTPQNKKKQITANVKENENNLQRVVNFGWLSPILGAPVCVLIGLYFTYCLPEESVHNYTTAVWMYALGSYIDLLAEPFVATAFYFMCLRLRAIAEGIALTLSCLTSGYLCIYHSDLGIMAFGLARLAFGIGYLGSFLAYFIYTTMFAKQVPFSISSLFPKRFPYIHKEQCVLSPKLFQK
jgi:oligosaccharide translocation protein RFT1